MSCSSYRAEVYTISDPRDGLVFYVGSSKNFFTRKESHCFKSSNTKVSNRIMEIKSCGLEPIFNIIDSCDRSNQFKLERKWIHYFFSNGFSLLNRKISNTTVSILDRKSPFTMMIDFDLLDEINNKSDRIKNGLSAYVEFLIKKDLNKDT